MACAGEIARARMRWEGGLGRVDINTRDRECARPSGRVELAGGGHRVGGTVTGMGGAGCCRTGGCGRNHVGEIEGNFCVNLMRQEKGILYLLAEVLIHFSKNHSKQIIITLIIRNTISFSFLFSRIQMIKMIYFSPAPLTRHI